MATAEQIANRKQVLSFIKAFPQFHDQNFYFCGTKACIAGTAIMFDRLRIQNNLISWFENGSAQVENVLGEGDWFYSEWEEAARILGLNEDEANNLFYCWDEASAVEILRALASEEPGNA